MSFSPVIPTEYSTRRADLYEALGVLVDAFIASESYQCGRAFRTTVPDSLTREVPLIVIGDVTEVSQPTIQLRVTTFTVQLYYLDWVTDREEFAARVNRWADRMRDLLRFNARLIPDGVLVHTGFQPGEMQQGKVVLGAPFVTVLYEVQDGGFQT